jgi:hypothetical protein
MMDLHRAQTRSGAGSEHTTHRAGWTAGAEIGKENRGGTVSTAHGARRATASATLPSSACDTPGRPCVPITIRSMLASAAY